MANQEDYHVLEAAEKDFAQAEDATPPQGVQLPCTIKNLHVRECLSEFLSVFVFVAFGLGVTAQVVISKGAAGDYTNATIAWGIGVMVALHVGGGVSHAHINPAITVPIACFGVFPWKKVPGYLISQILGAFFGSLMVYIIYYQQIHKMDPHKSAASASIFYSRPSASINHGGAFLNEMFATMLLLIGAMGFIDEKNRPTVVPNFPSCVGIVVTAIGMAFSLNTNGFNPARDLGPRLMLAVVGYDGVFSADGTYFWIPFVAPIVGGIIGVGVYLVFIMAHHPAKVHNHGFF